MESLKRKLHDDILRRWIDVRTPGHDLYGKPDYDDSHIQSIRVARGDELQSYGPHFPLVQAIRDPKRAGRPTRLWLLNGDTWRGSSGFGMSTSTQQSQVRNLTRATGVPWTIIPLSALDAAGIDRASIRVLAQDEETWESYTHTQRERPSDLKMVPSHTLIPGTGHEYSRGTRKYSSLSELPPEVARFFDSEGKALRTYTIRKATYFGRVSTDYVTPAADYASGDIRLTDYWGEPVESFTVPPCYTFDGMRPGDGWTHDAEAGTWSQRRQTHTLGQTVFRARYRSADWRWHWANFLSGIDNSPHGAGYFLVQLPRKAATDSVAAATESLKPQSVRAAESMGLDVKRQGDLFAIPTDFSLRQLRKMGAEVRESAKAAESKRAALRQSWDDRFTLALMELGIPTWGGVTPTQERNRKALHAHYSAMARKALAEFDRTAAMHRDRALYGTRHVGTDVAILPSGVVLARGTIRHTGGQHRFLSLGRTWHIVARNTVPLAR